MKYCVLLPVLDQAGGSDVRLDSLKKQAHKDWVAYLWDEGSPGAAKAAVDAAGDSRVQLAPRTFASWAEMINFGSESGSDAVMPVPEGVEFAAQALGKIAETLARPKAAAAFASYIEQKSDGSKQTIELFKHEGAFHERFDFGFVKCYRTDKLKEIGGARTDLVHAAEYDVDLKLTDNYTIDLVEEPVYTVHIPAEGAGEKKNSKLHSPGKGKYGGFSYVFYPADLDKEITGVFEEMLRRRNAYIDHETVEVPYPKEPYPILASVVIPVLDRAKFIGNAIERLQEQTYTNWEVIIVDNGSKDGTQDVVKKYVEKDPRVRFIQRAGGQIADALNEGIKAARGKYICQLDSDDEYKPDCLEMMVNHLESHPKAGLAISYYELMDENRGSVEDVPPVTHSGYTRNQILRRDGAGALRVFPKIVLEEMGYYDAKNFGNFGEDYDMVLKVGEKYDVDRVHKVLYRYRRHSDNTDVTRDPLMKVQNKNNSRLNALKRRQEINKKLGKVQKA